MFVFAPEFAESTDILFWCPSVLASVPVPPLKWLIPDGDLRLLTGAEGRFKISILSLF